MFHLQPDKNFGIFGHFWYLKNLKRPNGNPYSMEAGVDG